jgi:hypothetical protein
MLTKRENENFCSIVSYTNAEVRFEISHFHIHRVHNYFLPNLNLSDIQWQTISIRTRGAKMGTVATNFIIKMLPQKGVQDAEIAILILLTMTKTACPTQRNPDVLQIRIVNVSEGFLTTPTTVT